MLIHYYLIASQENQYILLELVFFFNPYHSGITLPSLSSISNYSKLTFKSTL